MAGALLSCPRTRASSSRFVKAAKIEALKRSAGSRWSLSSGRPSAGPGGGDDKPCAFFLESLFLFLAQFRTENRFALFLKLL
jgi:hypothetical protein